MKLSNEESPTDSIDKYYLEEAGSARDGKFLVKLKIPKSKEGTEEGEVASSVRKEHYCADCDKSFSSGKALGGHMSSAHVQAGKGYQSKKLRLKSSTKFKYRGSASSHDFGGASNELVCKICGKDFRSRKSLYGHMRCHPDREYRGMQPPIETPIENYKKTLDDAVDDASPMEAKEPRPVFASYYDDDSLDESLETYHQIDPAAMDSPVLDLTKFLTSWATTGQRGRQTQNPGIAWDPPLSNAEAEQFQQAVDLLINLGNGTPLDSKHKEEEKFEEAEDTSIDSMTACAEIEDLKPIKTCVTKKQSKEVYPAKKVQEFPVKRIKIGEAKPNADAADYYKDVKGSSKSKRKRTEGSPATDKRHFSPVKKLTIGERKPEKQIHQRASYKGKGKTPMEPKFGQIRGAFCESEDEDFSKGSDYDNNCFTDDSDSEKTLEQLNHKYLEYRKYNGFVPNKKRLEKAEDKKKPLSIKPQTNFGPVAEKKDDIPAISPEKFKCSTCDKSFPTHQALGGHRSSHNKLKISIQNSLEDSSPENQSNSISVIMEAKEGWSSTPGLKLAENPFHCQICNRTFSSGQALGGHMRSHVAGPSSQASSLEEDIQSVQKVLKFDLNELPGTEDGGN